MVTEWKKSPIVKARIYDRYKRDFVVLNKKAEKLPEEELKLRDAINYKTDRNVCSQTIYEMQILFNDITQEEEAKQKKLQAEAEKRKKSIFIFQFYHNKPMQQLGGVNIDLALDLWTLRQVIEEKLMKQK
jgi:hypothetical protein